DVAEVEEGIVLLGVAAGDRTREAGPRQPLGVGLPRVPGLLEGVGEVARRDAAARAVGADPLGGAAPDRQGAGQARVGGYVVVPEPGVAARKARERRCVTRADHLLLLLVLEHDHHDVREGRHTAGRLRRGKREGREQRERGDRPHAFSSTIRRRHTCTTTTTTTTASAPAIAAYTP